MEQSIAGLDAKVCANRLWRFDHSAFENGGSGVFGHTLDLLEHADHGRLNRLW